jgi:hypothetical protein
MDLDLGLMLDLVGLYGSKPNIKEPNLIRFIISLLGFLQCLGHTKRKLSFCNYRMQLIFSCM